MSKLSFLKSGLLTVAAGLLATSASAQLTTSLTASAQGWYNSFGDNSVGAVGPNFFVGSLDDGTRFNNFFVFDRSTDPLLQFAHITKATLELSLPALLFSEGLPYFSSDVNDTGAVFSLYKFEGDKAALKGGGTDAVVGADIFNDLGADAGGIFGSRAVSSADNVPDILVTVDLTAYFLDYLNGLNGEFALGGALSNPNDAPAPEDYEYMFAYSANSPMANLRLEFVAVPEPSTYGLIGAGMLGLLVWRRRAVKAVRKN